MLQASALGDTDTRIFIQYMRDTNLNGMEKMNVSIFGILLLKRMPWVEGERFQLDNVTLSEWRQGEVGPLRIAPTPLR